MSTFRFLHAADLHLDSPLRGLEAYPDAPLDQIRGATRRALENLVDRAIEEQVAFLLLAGDIYDGEWKDYHSALFFARCMGRLREAGIRVFLISGNHDAASVIARALRPPDNVHVFATRHPETVRLDALGVAIHGQGYARRDNREDMAAAYPAALPGLFNIGLLHTALNGRAGHEPYAPTSLAILAGKGYDYWALGHVHQREVVSQTPWVVFPGCLQGRHIREAGSKGAVLVSVEEGRVQEVAECQLDVLRWQECRLDVTGCDSLETLLQKVQGHFEAALSQADGRVVALRLRLAGTTSLHHELHRNLARWTEECRALAAGLGSVWLEKLMLDTRPLATPWTGLEDDSPLAGLIRAVQDLTLSGPAAMGVGELAELRSRLPVELTGDGDPFDCRDPERLGELQEEVRELLLGRLLGQGRVA